jgi:GGDEF domain-containing protein
VEEKNVAIAIDRLRKQFETQMFTVAGHTFSVTASFGITGFRGTTLSISAIS